MRSSYLPVTVGSSFILGALIQLSSEQTLNTSSYAPIFVECPTDVEWLRPATTELGPEEAAWVYGRKKNVLTALDGYLERLGLEDFDYQSYVSKLKAGNYSDVPTLGIAISGGGYSSAFTGTAGMRAMDNRLAASNEQKTGGLLQALTYMSGLSGGAFPIMSFAAYNFPTADELLVNWQPEIDRFDANVTTQFAATNDDMFEIMAEKLEAGFPIGIPDYFAIAYGYYFLPPPNGGLGRTFSSFTTLSNFASHEMPFPLLEFVPVENGDTEIFGLLIPDANATVYEVSPFEFGSWAGPKQFTRTEYLGTTFNNGVPANSSACVLGYDSAGYMIGAATAALNFWYIEDMSNGTLAPFAKRSVDKRTPTKSTKHHGAEVSKSLKKRDGLFPLATLEELIDAFEEFFDLNYTQIAYGQFPNPFPSIDTETLMTVDGSESGGGIPVWPQIQPARKSDFIIAWDGSTDAIPFGWQNGTNLHNTYIQAKADGIPFPVIPPASTFVKNNYTTKPVFFGCDAELTTTNSVESPIILYIANAPYSAFTNYSFFQDDFSFTQMHEIYTNGFNQVTQGNGTLDKEWPACLGCAAIDRSLAKVGMSRTAQCDQCFEKYCWDGTVYDGEVGIVDLSLVLDPSLSFAEWLTTNPF